MKPFKSRPNVFLILILAGVILAFVFTSISYKTTSQALVTGKNELEGELSLTKQELDLATLLLNNITERFELTQQNIERFGTLYEEKESDLQTTQTTLNTTAEDLKRAQDNIKLLNSRIITLDSTIVNLTADIKLKNQTITNLTTRIQTLNAQKENLLDDLLDLCNMQGLPTQANSICEDY